MKTQNIKMFSAGLIVGLMLFIGTIVGIRLAVNTSIVNQLQHYTQTTRTNDMFHPKIVSSNEGIMEVELTLPNLNMINNEFDRSDILCYFGRIENPITSVYDWFDRGQFLDEFYFNGIDYDAFCDAPDPSYTYYTHFYYMWNTAIDLVAGYTYVLMVDFYDGDGNFHYCENVWDWMGFFFEDGFPQVMSLNVDEEPPPEEEIIAWLLDCDYISFFEYQVQTTTDEGETATPTDTGGTSDGGAEAGGWLNQYTIFSSIQNWVATIIFLLILLLFGIIIAFIVFYMKNKEDDKKKKKKK